MQYLYERMEEAVRIRSCFAYGAEIEIPEEIDGFPVTELAPYCFSEHQDRKKLEQDLKEGKLKLWGEGEEPVLNGNRLKAVYLPSGLKKIGAYAFYNCSALEELHFYGKLLDLGAGLFTGCHHIRKL